MGGFVAQRLAQQAPGRVEALALLSTDPGGPVAAEIDRRFGAVVAAARARLTPQVLAAQEAAMEAWHAVGPKPDGDGARRSTPLGHPSLPVLVAHGSEDVVIPAANAAALAARWPGAEVELFAGGGHAFMAQEPQRIAALLTSFLGS